MVGDFSTASGIGSIQKACHMSLEQRPWWQHSINPRKAGFPSLRSGGCKTVPLEARQHGVILVASESQQTSVHLSFLNVTRQTQHCTSQAFVKLYRRTRRRSSIPPYMVVLPCQECARRGPRSVSYTMKPQTCSCFGSTPASETANSWEQRLPTTSASVRPSSK